MSVTEAAFEDDIASWLVEHGGYGQVKIGNDGDSPRDFDAETGVDTADLFVFIGATQAEQWARLVDSAYGGDPNRAQSGFVQRLASEFDKRGTVDVLRNGVVDRNIKIRLAYFKPAHGLTPESVEQYRANVLTVTRQLPFDPDSNQTIDLALFVNGIPVATAELKNPYTNQTVENAIAQYRHRPHRKSSTSAPRSPAGSTAAPRRWWCARHGSTPCGCGKRCGTMPTTSATTSECSWRSPARSTDSPRPGPTVSENRRPLNVSTPTNGRSWSSPRSSRPVSTSPSSPPCTSTRHSPDSPPCRPSQGSTASTPTRQARSSLIS